MTKKGENLTLNFRSGEKKLLLLKREKSKTAVSSIQLMEADSVELIFSLFHGESPYNITSALLLSDKNSKSAAKAYTIHKINTENTIMMTVQLYVTRIFRF